MRKSFKNYCKKYVLDHIDEFEGTVHYGADFCITITEDINRCPDNYFNRKEAINAIKAWMDEAAEYWDYEERNFGEHFHNPFENPEHYVACMIIENIRGMLGYCDVLNDSWNDKILLTPDVIREIKKYVRSVTMGHFF